MPARRFCIGLAFCDLDDLRDKLLDVMELGEELWLVGAIPLADLFVAETIAWGIEQIDTYELSMLLARPFGHEEAEDLAVQLHVVGHGLLCIMREASATDAASDEISSQAITVDARVPLHEVLHVKLP
jgi:hypothetical protein